MPDVSETEPNVILTGGPSGPGEVRHRVRFSAALDSKIKVLRGDRYEHFEPTSETTLVDGRELRVFVWSGMTRVAE